MNDQPVYGLIVGLHQHLRYAAELFAVAAPRTEAPSIFETSSCFRGFGAGARGAGAVAAGPLPRGKVVPAGGDCDWA
jgi:hypothetical protein